MYEIRKLFDDQYMVRNVISGKIHSYHTTLSKAQAQVRLLNSIDKKRLLGG